LLGTDLIRFYHIVEIRSQLRLRVDDVVAYLIIEVLILYTVQSHTNIVDAVIYKRQDLIVG